ncbi:MAG: hypothetical protein HDR29_07340, partial [Lachnospiraceae bacterium]|nr:hypothetical protein [Lachnospiraceae bacterium]
MRKKKMRAARIISMLLAVTMVLTSLPQSMMSVSAAEIVSEDTVSSDTQKEGEVPGNMQGSNSDEDASNDAKLDGETSDADSVQDDNSGSETSEDDKQGEGSSEDGEFEEEGSEGNKESGETTEPETEDGLSENEEENDEISADPENEDEEEADMVEDGEEWYVPIRFVSSDDDKFEILDSEDEPIGRDISVQYGSTETIKFKVVPNEGYVIAGIKSTNKVINLSRTEEGGGYNCEINPRGSMGYQYDTEILVMVREKKNYNLTFVYAGENVEALVATNGTVQHQPVSNEAIQTTNVSSTSFRLKMQGDKAPVVIEEPVGNTDDENRFTLTPDKQDADGYYCYDLGKVLEDTIITIDEGWKVSFTYNENRIYLYRYGIIGDEADIGLEESDVEFYEVGEIEHDVFVAKGEPLYFNFDRDESLATISVVDGDGKPCKRFADFEGSTLCYKVVPQGNMNIIIEEIPREIPISFVEGTVKNIRVSSTEDERITYDPEKKKIVNIFNEDTECSLSFELEDKEGKPLSSVMTVRHYDDGYESYTEYEEIEVEANDDGVYTGTFYIGYDFTEIRIIAGESHTIDFEVSDGVNVYYGDEEQIVTGSSCQITDGAEFILRMHMQEGYELATLSAVATIGDETRELEVKIVDSYYDDSYYRLSIIPKADMSVKISTVPKSIPFKYAEGAIKDIAAEKLSLAEDKKKININSYYELTEGRITFTPETGKTATRAYYEFTMPVYDEDDGETQIGTKTYNENIPLSYDESTNTYTLGGISFSEDIADYMDLDGIYVIAGDTSELTFDVPEGKASVYSFNNYKYDYENGALTGTVSAAQNQEYLFGVKLSDKFDAATFSVTAGDRQEELAVKYFIRSKGMWEEDEIIAYYGYTPTSAAETIHINVDPQSIPVKYEADAVESLILLNAEAENKPELKDNKVLLWSYNTALDFELKLKSDKKLSRIFSRRAEENGSGSIEQEIQFKLNENNDCYEFIIENDSKDLLEIEIVTDKINLCDCTPKLMLENEELGRTEDESKVYHVSYMAREIRPEVVLTYSDGTSETETILSADKYDVSYENNKNAGMATA